MEWLSEDYMKTYFSREKAVVSQIYGDEWESALKFKGCDSFSLLVLRGCEINFLATSASSRNLDLTFKLST